jgi:threonine dehydrogenase-like Zn-dependent dehydrogenase
MDGVQAEYFRVPCAQANLARIPDGLSDEEVLFVTDIATTGISAVETARTASGPCARRAWCPRPVSTATR